jgi:hypothetical protein
MPEADTPRTAELREEISVSVRLSNLEQAQLQTAVQLVRQTVLLEQIAGYQGRREEREIAAEKRLDSSAEDRRTLRRVEAEATTQERATTRAWFRQQLERITPTVSQAAGLVLLGAATAIGGVLTAFAGWLTGFLGNNH